MGYDMTWREDQDEEGSYYRLSIWGMAEMRELMAKFNMIHNRAECPKDWPECPETSDGEEDYENPEYVAACDKIRVTSVEYPGIPSFKFGSNDGWWVTPIECVSALKEWEKLGKPMPEDIGLIFDEPGNTNAWFLKWCDYLAASALHAGFQVW